LIQAIQQGTEQNVQGFQMMAQELQKLQQMMLAPRKAIKDKKTGKTIGVEIAGAGTVQVQ
jgi:ribosomal protein L13E